MSLAVAASEVLGQFSPEFARARLIPLGNRGGFSGASLWRVETESGHFCLKAWPLSGPTPERLGAIHVLLQQARRADLPFIPSVQSSRNGATWVTHAGRLWDVQEWMRGSADFHARSTPARLAAACTALAQLHGAWESGQSTVGPCPALQRRLDAWQEWCRLCETGWRLPGDLLGGDPVHPWAERAWRLLAAYRDEVPRRLAAWRAHRLRLHPCLCDIWHDHVLFEGDTVTGLIDFGSIKEDHVSVDLARLLGSLCGNDAALRAAGFDAYRRVRALSGDEQALSIALDETGTLVGMANWLKWLYLEQRGYEDREAVARRLNALVQRVETWR
jgi:Ser/Thr protein kinase RdoA (MazF antagonist)